MNLFSIVRVHIPSPGISLVNEDICLLVERRKSTAAKTLDLAAKCNMTYDHSTYVQTHRLGILKLYIYTSLIIYIFWNFRPSVRLSVRA
jgi:hypothetical protein